MNLVKFLIFRPLHNALEPNPLPTASVVEAITSPELTGTPLVIPTAAVDPDRWRHRRESLVEPRDVVRVELGELRQSLSSFEIARTANQAAASAFDAVRS